MQTGLKGAIELHVNFGDTTSFYIPGSLQDLWDFLLTGISCPLTPQFHHKRLVLLNKEVAQSSWTILSSSSFFCSVLVLMNALIFLARVSSFVVLKNRSFPFKTVKLRKCLTQTCI